LLPPAGGLLKKAKAVPAMLKSALPGIYGYFFSHYDKWMKRSSAQLIIKDILTNEWNLKVFTLI